MRRFACVMAVAFLAGVGQRCSENPTEPVEALNAGETAATLDAAAVESAATAGDVDRLLTRLENAIRGLVPRARGNATLTDAVNKARRLVWNARNELKNNDVQNARRFTGAALTATRAALQIARATAPSPTRPPASGTSTTSGR